MNEIIVDSFAGGGGASMGIEMALGRSPDIAINHDAEALSMHARNHPEAVHLPHNIWKVDPIAATGGRPVGLLWASPDCKHFSKAKGGKPVSKNIRDLAWVVVRWARQVRPRVIILENVEEFRTWGPLAVDGMPCPERRGKTFDAWVGELRRLGYRVEWRDLRACDFGAPTIRKRFFLIARRDGAPIVWPAPTHGAPDSEGVRAGRLKPWRTAAEIIDWSIPCPSIFLSREEGRAIGVNRPLAEATMARIAKGVRRYVIESASPFLVPITHTGSDRCNAIDEPLRTITTAHRGEHAVVSAYLAQHYTGQVGREAEAPLSTIVHRGTQQAIVAAHLQAYYGEGSGGLNRGASADEPIRTVVTENRHAVVAAFLAQHNGGPRPGAPAHEVGEPLSTVTASGSQQAVVSAGLVNLRGSDRRGCAIDAPAPTVTGGGTHAAEVRAFLVKYYGADQDPRLEEPMHTATTKARFGLVHVHGEPYQIVDIGMRMLSPRELFRAQGFPDSYVIDQGADGTPLTKTAQIRMCGNSVCPPMAAALVAANYTPVAMHTPLPVSAGPLFEVA